MTIRDIQREVKRRAKPMTRAGLYKHIRALGLKRRGVGRPAIYPDDAAQKIVVRLGYETGKEKR